MAIETDTAGRIRAAALELFASRGFEGTGIRQIAERAGITVASLYHYMGTKEDLLEGMMRESMGQLLAPAKKLVEDGGDPVELIGRLTDLHVRRHALENQLCRVGDTEIRSLSPERRRAVVALRDEYQGIWEHVIIDGIGAGRFQVPDVKLAAFALMQMCTGVAHWYRPDGRLSLDKISAGLVEMALNLLDGGDHRSVR